MNRYLDFILDRPFWVIGAIALITCIFAFGLTKLQFESSLDSILPKQDKEYALNEEIKEIFGNNGKFIVMCITSDNVFNYSFLKTLDDLHEDLEEYRMLNKEKEEARKEKLGQFLSDESIPRKNLIAAFDDDPVFQRFLKRKCSILFDDKTTLVRSDIEDLQQELENTIALKKEEIIDIVVSPLTIQDIKGEDNALVVFDVFEKDDYNKRIIPKSEDELKAFETRLTNNPAYSGGIYARDKVTGKITDFGVMIRLQDSFVYDPIVNEVKEIVGGYSNLNIMIQGIPVLYREVNEYMKNDLIRFIPLVFLVVIMIFFLNFRTFRGVFLPFVTLLLADIWILGLMGHLGFKLTIIGIALPPLMIAVGSSYAIHVLNQYYIDLSEITRLGKREGLKVSMSHISTTVALAGMTTFVGFIMLITNQVSSIREWGVFSAIGVLFAVIIAISLIPAALVLLPHKDKTVEKKTAKANRKGLVDYIIAVFTSMTIGHPKKVIASTLVIMILAIAGLYQIVVETSVHAYFKEGDQILTSSRIIGEKFGGAFGLNIIFDSGKEDGVKDPKFLNAVEGFRSWLVADENIDLNVGRTDAFGDFVKTFNLAMNNNDKDYYKIPPETINVESYIDLFSGDDEDDDGRIDAFESYVDGDYRKANVFARVWEKQGELLSSADMDNLIVRVDQHLRDNFPSEYTYQISGVPKVIVRLSRYVVNGQIMSLTFSLIVVFLIVLFLFRNWSAGFVSLIPIGVAVLFNFGVMGWLGIKLDIATAIIASITIGIGIDDTIHFLNTFRYFKSKGFSIDDTIEKTIAISGKAIIYTSLALIFGFLVLIISNFKPILLFGELVAITMIATTIGALVVLPATIKATGVTLEESEEKTGLWKYINFKKVFESE